MGKREPYMKHKGVYVHWIMPRVFCTAAVIEKGAEVNAQGGYFGNALQAASYAGHKNIVAILSTAGSVVNAEDVRQDNLSKVFLMEPPHDAIATTSKKQSIFKVLWRHIIPRSTILWLGLVFAMTGGLVLVLVRGRRMAFIASEAVRRSGIRGKTCTQRAHQ